MCESYHFAKDSASWSQLLTDTEAEMEFGGKRGRGGRGRRELKSEFFVCCPQSLPFSIITTSVNSFLRYGEQQVVLVYNANDA